MYPQIDAADLRAGDLMPFCGTRVRGVEHVGTHAVDVTFQTPTRMGGLLKARFLVGDLVYIDPELCSANTGGDPVSGCEDAAVRDGLCERHYLAHTVMATLP